MTVMICIWPWCLFYMFHNLHMTVPIHCLEMENIGLYKLIFRKIQGKRLIIWQTHLSEKVCRIWTQAVKEYIINCNRCKNWKLIASEVHNWSVEFLICKELKELIREEWYSNSHNYENWIQMQELKIDSIWSNK
jgi:hypothetical protein